MHERFGAAAKEKDRFATRCRAGCARFLPPSRALFGARGVPLVGSPFTTSIDMKIRRLLALALGIALVLFTPLARGSQLSPRHHGILAKPRISKLNARLL
jgi:hypothetical protein